MSRSKKHACGHFSVFLNRSWDVSQGMLDVRSDMICNNDMHIRLSTTRLDATRLDDMDFHWEIYTGLQNITFAVLSLDCYQLHIFWDYVCCDDISSRSTNIPVYNSQLCVCWLMYEYFKCKNQYTNFTSTFPWEDVVF